MKVAQAFGYKVCCVFVSEPITVMAGSGKASSRYLLRKIWKSEFKVQTQVRSKCSKGQLHCGCRSLTTASVIAVGPWHKFCYEILRAVEVLLPGGVKAQISPRMRGGVVVEGT